MPRRNKEIEEFNPSDDELSLEEIISQNLRNSHPKKKERRWPSRSIRQSNGVNALVETLRKVLTQD